MNRGKESTGQKGLLYNLRIASDEGPSQNGKYLSKFDLRNGISPSKNFPPKDIEAPFQRPIVAKVRLPKQNNSRANSADKLSSPLTGNLKMKAMANGKMDTDFDPQADQQENAQNHEYAKKEISPNKERPFRGISKTREGQLRKEALEVVSEENEEYFRETLNGLSKKGTMSHSKSVQRLPKEPLTSIQNNKRTEFVLQELFSVKTKIADLRKPEEELESSKKSRQQLELFIDSASRPPIDSVLTPQPQTEEENSNDMRTSSHVRGIFMKEHISSGERQKEQDQKKLMKEYLDSQVNEKKRLKQEEKLRKIEEEKKEDLRLQREAQEIKIQYERETYPSKGRLQESKLESPLKESRQTALRKEEKVETKKGNQERESYREAALIPIKPLRSELPKEGVQNKKDSEEKPVVKDIKKLTEENKQLRDQNDKKNELIDMLLVALKNHGKDGLPNPEFLEGEYLNGPQSQNNARQKSVVPSRNSERFDLNFHRKQEILTNERANNSPWTVGGTHFLRFETENPDSGSEEQFEFDDIQPSTQRATGTLSKLVNPNNLIEIKLPAIPDFYYHRKGPTFLSNSNLQQLDNLNTGQPSSRFPGTPYTKVSPRQFSLNISSPTSSMSMKQKNDIPTTVVTPKLYNRMTHFNRSKIEENTPLESFNGIRLGPNLESYRIPSTASQLSVKKASDHFLPIVQFPTHRNATAANNQRVIGDIRNPIRVVDMVNRQQIQTSRPKGNYMEKVETKVARMLSEDARESQSYLLTKEKEPKVLGSVEGEFFKYNGNDNNFERVDLEGDLGAKRAESSSSKSKFPKEVFCLNLRKKVGV